MAYWWVNQGQTYAEEREGGYLWSPKHAKNGSRRRYYDAMQDAAVDDLVFHYVGKPTQSVRSVSVVTEVARSHEQPIELRHTGLWDNDGWLLPVAHVEQVTPVPKRVAIELGPDEAPFTRDGKAVQGYLFPLTAGFGRALLELADPDATTSPSQIREPRALDAPAVPMASTVPLEAGRRLQFDQIITPARRAATRTEWVLVDSFVQATGVEAKRRRYDLPDGTVLHADLFVEGARLLVEAKASAGRSAIREAIGQLHDYAHKESEPVTKVLLVPRSPAEDLLEVLSRLGIRVLWPDSESWTRATKDLEAWSAGASQL